MSEPIYDNDDAENYYIAQVNRDLDQIWANEMNGKVPAGTYRNALRQHYIKTGVIVEDPQVANLQSQLAEAKKENARLTGLLEESERDNVSLRERHVTQAAADRIRLLEAALRRIAEHEHLDMFKSPLLPEGHYDKYDRCCAAIAREGLGE